MINFEGMKDWRTTVPFVIAAISTFVVNEPSYFPPLVVAIAKYLMALGFAVGGVNAMGGRKK